MGERGVAGAVLLLLLGTVALIEARRLATLREEMVAGAVVGDDTFPWVIGAALVLLGLYILVGAVGSWRSWGFPGRQRPRLAPGRALAFDDELTSLLRRYCPGGTVVLPVAARTVWGRPAGM